MKTDAQTIRSLADLLEKASAERVDTDRLRAIADKIEVSTHIEHALGAIIDELVLPEEKWPTDPVHTACIHAVAIRMLMGLDQYIRKPDTEPDICGACAHWLSEGYDKCGVCGREL